MTLPFWGCAVFALAAAACAASPIDDSKLIDLTHAFDENTIHWPTAKPFRWHKDAWGRRPDGHWYASASFSASEHLGTHFDSPIHFAEGQATSDRVPLQQFVGPAAVIDITQACASTRDYQLSPADIAAWEKAHGRIPQGATLLVRTGWSAFWPERERYMGTAAPLDVSNLHFPGVSPDAAKVLVERRVDAVGIDTASLDHGPSTEFPTHRILSEAGVIGLENLANLDRLPLVGATVIALPMKIRNGTGGPIRAIALLP